MLTLRLLWASFVYVFVSGATAASDWWLQGLPTCWQNCLNNTGNGCSSTECICQTTENNAASYLPNAVSCAVSACHADQWSLDLVLGSLSLYCRAVEHPIPDSVMNAAYTAATGQPYLQMTSTTKSSQSQRAPTQSTDDLQALTTTVRATITRTTTDGNGNTLQVIVPLIMGPSGMSTGQVVTSTVHATASSDTPSPSSTAKAAASPSSQHPSSTSLETPRQTKQSTNGNGSPFENMQAAAARNKLLSSLLGLCLLLALFIRL